MYIYLDELFLTNFVSEIVLILTVKKIMNYNMSIIHLVLSSVLLSFFGTLYYIFNFNNTYNVFFALPIKTIFLYLIFMPKSIRLFLKCVLCYFCALFIFGGCVLFIKNLSGGLTYVLLFAAFFIGYIIFSEYCHLGRKATLKKAESVNIKIIKNNIEVNVLSVIDTGNSLYDCISRLPVIVTDYDSVKVLLSENVRTAFESGCDPVEIFAASPLELRLIPYKSLGVKHGRIIGFRADKILSDGMQIDAIIGVSPLPLSAENEYNGLVSPIVYV